MELTLNYSPMGDPMDGQDIKWLQYVWECSDGKEVYLYEDKIPDTLRHTVIYSCLFQRFSFYKDSQKLFYDFEFNEENQCYYIVLEDGFVSALNFIIDNINYESYIPEFNISHIQDKGQVIMNNINNSGTFNAPVNNQIGNQNSSKQSQENQKQSGIKINFTAMLKALLKKIPFIKDFVE
ncbi:MULTISPECIES: hypothetical protein [Eubacteriales]|jgi:hypothetical protein|uniref:hypothetical protein n=1 Tax=Eubacteriales TaxID=186802 RepID=UPI0027B9FFB2|nr:hypothetical protein [Agathobaculum sp.]